MRPSESNGRKEDYMLIYFVRIIMLTFVMATQACVFAPGQKLNMSEHPERSVESDYVRPAVPIVTISPALLLEQAKKEGEERPVVAPLTPSDETGVGYEYRISPYDVLRITVWDHPELTNPSGGSAVDSTGGNIVRNDGTIFYPYAGVVSVAGKTVEDIRIELTARLKDYIENPQLDVKVLTFRGQKVYVTGEVLHPQVVAIKDAPMTVLEAIQLAGGEKETSDLQHVRLVSANGTVEYIDILAFMRDGDTSQNRLVKDGDTIHVPDNYYNKVFVTGEVSRPASIPLVKGSLTLAEALSEAGGLNMKTSNPEKVFVIRVEEATDSGEYPKGVIYHLDASSPDAYLLADQFHLKARDVIFVSTAEVVRWGRVMDNLATTIQALAITRLFIKDAQTKP